MSTRKLKQTVVTTTYVDDIPDAMTALNELVMTTPEFAKSEELDWIKHVNKLRAAIMHLMYANGEMLKALNAAKRLTEHWNSFERIDGLIDKAIQIAERKTKA